MNKSKMVADKNYKKWLTELKSAEIPDMKGFSLSNLRYIRQWHLFYSEQNVNHQQPVGDLEKYKTIGISEYQLTQLLPENLKENLSSIEEIEAKLNSDEGTRL